MDRWQTVPEMMHAIRLAVLKTALVLIAFALLGKNWPVAIGLSVGVLLALWHFGSLCKSARKSVQMTKHQAEAYAAIRYMIRYAVLAIALFALRASQGINIAAVFVGLLLPKVVIVGYALRSVIVAGGRSYLHQLTRKRVRKEG